MQPPKSKIVAPQTVARKTPVITDWSDIASWYDQLVGEGGSEYHQRVVLPGVLRLLKVEQGQRVLDAACGQGVLARLLAMRDVRVTAFDSSKALIDSARVHNDGLEPSKIRHAEYMVLDATKPFGQFLPQNTFDSAACVLAIQNIHPIQPLCEGVAGALKPGGRFVIAMMHPCFRGPKETFWGWDATDKVQYRRVDRYLLPRKAPIVAHPGMKESHYTWSFHKPIESYVKCLRNAGLLIDAIEEWPSHKTSQPGARQAAENQSRKEIPMFMAIRAIKVGDVNYQPEPEEPQPD
ncbi:MAG: methyltransferase domain-containing protein [Burkholderiales bacterium]|nr:methyltransferase domain-containing protein [Phycisphaerae bacterium]